MSKNALRKDFFMELRKTANRFLSIFLIAALGAAFFSGIRASQPDMQLSADQLFDESNLMDIRILSTYGLTEEDKNAVSQIKGVKEVINVYTYDVLSYQEEKQSVLKLQSLSPDMNKITLTEGRFPTKANECIIDKALTENNGYALHDQITVQSGTQDPLTDTIKNEQFTVVGVGTTPYYLSLEREASSIGNGTVDGFVMIPEENFLMDYYSELAVTVEGARELVSYRQDYVDLVEDVVSSIEDITDKRCEIRYMNIKKEAEDKINDAKAELADAEEEANQKLDDAWEKITDAKQKIADGKEAITEGEQKIADGKKDIENAKKELEDGKSAYNSGKEEIEKAKEEYQKGRNELESKKKEAGKAEAELTEKEETFALSRAAIEEKKKELKSSKPFLSEEEYNRMQEEISAYEQPITEGENQVSSARQKLEEGKLKIAEGEKKLEEAESEIKVGEEKLKLSLNKITQGETDIAEGEKKLAKNEKKLKKASRDITEGEKELEENEGKYYEAKDEADQKLQDAKEELKDAEEKTDLIKMPEWYVLERSKMQVLAEFGQNADRIGAIGKVFPVIFFLVAVLVCLTTMTRMVEEQRTQIGTLKALGYTKRAISAKYLYYAGIASIFGGIFGTVIGQKILPAVIIGAYHIMYINLPYASTPFNYYYGITSILAVCACTILAVFFSCIKELRESAAQLMRPEAPKAGKRVILEKIPFLWKHISFTMKASIRNLFRYKKRFFMTAIGIAGCMALLLVGFGVRDSVHDIAYLQYEKIFSYNGSVKIKDSESDAEKDKLYQLLGTNEQLLGYKPILETSITISSKDIEKNASLIVPMEEEGFEEYIRLDNRKTGEKYTLSAAKDGVILTEKAASLLGVSVGDSIKLKIDELTQEEVTVRCITENYALHYVYMQKNTYESLFNKDAAPNILFFNYQPDKEVEEEQLGKTILEYPAASEVSFNSNSRKNIEDMLDSLDIVVWVLIISAGLLAFVVLYNLNNININERKRELATLKVLGFYDMEVASYVYRENIMLSVIGIIAGIFLGIVLHRYVILTAEVDILMFSREIAWKSYLYSAGLSMLFSVLINLVMYYKLKKIDMVESLKSVE